MHYLVVDSTGFSSTSASTCYTRVLKSRGGQLGGRRRGVETRRYVRQAMAVEARRQLIASVKLRSEPSGEILNFVWTLKKVRSARLPVKLVVVDKSYDAESNHECAQDVLSARTVILVCGANRPKINMRGKRRRQLKCFDRDGYDGHRPELETVFSAEKCKMDSIVAARVPNQQHKELIFRGFSHNPGRLEARFLLFTEVLYRASPSQD